MAEHHAGERPGDKAHGKAAERRHGAEHRVFAGEEQLPEHQGCGEGVDVEIIEFDGGANKGSRRGTTRGGGIALHLRLLGVIVIGRRRRALHGQGKGTLAVRC
ncbi:hypothetical protein D3C80_947590 [compost metagenome]